MPDDKANIVNVFLQAAGSWPHQTALLHEGKSVTYETLLERVRQAAGALSARGIRKGDAVLVAVPMSLELYVSVLALFYIGGIPVFLDAWVGRRRMAHCMETVPCKAMIAPRKLLWLSLLYGTLRSIPVKFTPESFQQGIPLPAQAQVDFDDTALVTFTTGSTGRPKAADRSHRILHAQLHALRPLLPQGREISFTTLPIVVLLHLAMGKSTVLPPSRYKMKKPQSIRHLHRAILMHGIHTLVVSPSVMMLLTKPGPLPSLRRIITGGGTVFPQLARMMISRFPEADCTIVYGSTEAEPIAHTDATTVAGADAELLRHMGLPLGVPDAAAAVQIIPCKEGPVASMDPASWRSYCLPACAPGEIVVSGEHVLQRYISNPEAEALHKIKVDGTVWHRTGDAGRLDKLGRLYFLGRCEEILHEGGKMIFPLVVEHALMKFPGISGAAILRAGSDITVVLETRDRGQHEEAVRAVLSDHGISGPLIVRMAVLPRDPRHLTKLDYTALRKMLRA